MSKIPTEVYYSKKLPLLNDLHPTRPIHDFVVIVDKKVLSSNKQVNKWLTPFAYVYAVDAGEKLKNADRLTKHLKQIFALLESNSHRGLTFIAIGGGSLGDFAGFVASIFKRGIDLIHIPSTWLAAIDSAHGGKNGLNLGTLKNQIGTFHHPKKVFIVQDVLVSQPKQQMKDSLGELYKMALITNKAWGRQLLDLNNISLPLFWKFIPLAVAEKYQIVRRDPFEAKGLRHFLNLGHTFGHVIELGQKLPHGRAVAVGLRVALELSYESGLLNQKTWSYLQATPMFCFLKTIHFKPLPEKYFLKVIAQDKKKISSDTIQFVCLKNLGKPVLKGINIKDLISAGKKYGFISNLQN